MAPKYINNDIIELILYEYLEGSVQWDSLQNDLIRYLNDDEPTIYGLTENFRSISYDIFGLSPRKFLNLLENSNSKKICKVVLGMFGYIELMKCHEFIISINTIPYDRV